MKDKISIIGKNVNVNCFYVTLNNIKCYKLVTYDDKDYEYGKEKYKVAFVGTFEFHIDIITGEPSCAEGIKNSLIKVGSGFFKELFREQVPAIEKECKKGFRSIKKQLKEIKFRPEDEVVEKLTTNNFDNIENRNIINMVIELDNLRYKLKEYDKILNENLRLKKEQKEREKIVFNKKTLFLKRDNRIYNLREKGKSFSYIAHFVKISNHEARNAYEREKAREKIRKEKKN